MSFLKDLPRYMKSLSLDRANRGSDSADDVKFLSRLDLFTGVDPNVLCEVAFTEPWLQWLALDHRLAKPSIENQRKVMSFFNSPTPDIRAAALTQLADWYGEYDKWASAKWFPGASGPTVPNEEALRAYWIGKIGDPIHP